MRLSRRCLRPLGSFAVTATLILMLAVPALAQQDREQEKPKTPPAISIETKAAAIGVTIEAALKPYRELAANCLAEGRQWAAKARAEADKERRENPDFFSEDRRYTYEREYALRSAVGRFISVVRSDSTYTGGAHGNLKADTILWDNETKKRISVRPFFKETADNGPAMTTLARLARLAVAAAKQDRHDKAAGDEKNKEPKKSPEQWLREDSQISDRIRPSLLKVGPISLAPSTEVGKSAGFTFHYSPYDVDAYAAGPYTVFVPWTEFKTHLSPLGLATFAGERPKDDEANW